MTPGDAAVSSVDDHRRSSRPVGSFDGSQELNPGTKDFVCSSCTKGESVVSIPVHTQRDRESIVEWRSTWTTREVFVYPVRVASIHDTPTPSAIIATDIIGIIS